MPRELIATTDTYNRYRITDDGGNLLGYDDEAILTTEQSNVATLDSRCDTALANLRAYRDLSSPTTAQTVAVIKLICTVLIALIRLQRNLLDGTD